MEEMDILKYFNENASKEDWKLAQQVYAYDLSRELELFSMQGKETFTLAELAVIYTRICLEKDLSHMETIDQEVGRANNESTKEMYIDLMQEILKEYQAEGKKEEENNG